MTIAIELHGSITHGVWSPERGESRYAQNYAALLAANGYDVIGFGAKNGNNDGWRLGPRIPGLRYMDWSEIRGQNVDVLLDSAWWQGKQPIVNAKKVVRAYFGEHNCTDWANNHVLVAPHRDSPYAVTRREGGSPLLPEPHAPSSWWSQFSGAERLREPVPTFADRRTIIWSSRYAFGEGDKSPDEMRYRWADILLKKCEDLDAKGYQIVFFGADYFRRGFSKPGDYYDVENRVARLHNKIVLSPMPYGDALDHIRRSRLLLSCPIYGPSMFDAAFEGVAPLLWTGMNFPTFEAAAQEHGLLLDADKYNAVHLSDVVDRLVEDAFLNRRAAASAALPEHLPEACLQAWRSVVGN